MESRKRTNRMGGQAAGRPYMRGPRENNNSCAKGNSAKRKN